MLKKIASTLKIIFGSKKKKTASDPEIAKKEIQTSQKPPAASQPQKQISKKVHQHEKPRVEKQFQAPRKKVIPQKPKVEEEPWDESLFKVPHEEGKTRFHDLKLPKEILRAVYELGFKYCTHVQAETLPKSLTGEDVTAQAQTGTGKTAAFLITIFNHLIQNKIDRKRKHGTPRALILAPTRELVLQIEKDALALGKYLNVKILSILGGVGYVKQLQALKSETVDVVICTPGRLIDFIQKNLVDLSKLEILIIDEADRMLDMGFIPSVKKIVASTPAKAKRQTMFFSATISGDVKRLAESWTRQAAQVNIKPEEVAVQSVEQIIYITTYDEKKILLYNLIMQQNLERVLVFVNRRDEAKRVKETFEHYGISCALLSGDVEQNQRIKRLEKFREGKVRVLVATDVASRGIHVDNISHVINYNIPQDVEEYVHRIGRTGRAGATGISISFADEFDSHELPRLEEYLGKKIECVFPDETLLKEIPEIHKQKSEAKPLSIKSPRRPTGKFNNNNYRNKGGSRKR